jgi:HEAT repeat protein
VQCLAERFSGDVLGNYRGAVCLAALKAYGKVDDITTNAYLAYARAQGNVHPGSPCLHGLAACAAEGKSAELAKQLVLQEHSGYVQLLRCGLLLEVLGKVSSVVDAICDTLDADQNSHRLAQYVERCCEAILAVSLLSEPMASEEHGFEWIRRNPEWRRQSEPRHMDAMVAALRRCPADRNGIARIAGRVSTATSSQGTSAIAEWFAKRQDNLGEYFIETTMRAAESVSFSPSTGLSKETPLAQIEDLIISQHHRTLQELLPRLVYLERKLSRYVLDLMRRRSIRFIDAARQVLQGGCTAEDALFVLESLALEEDDANVVTLAEATEFNSPDKKAAATVREKAITLACEVIGRRASAVSPVLLESVLGKLHARFQDVPAVRLAAYTACGRLAEPKSIKPLKDRLKSDRDGTCTKAIGNALRGIGERLRTARPIPSDAGSLVTWLGHVGDLGDKTLLPDVLPLLLSPHSSPDVRVAALQCVEHIGDPGVIAQIDEFVAETSPSDEILNAARHAKMTLLGRADLELVEVLSRIMPPDSPALEPSIDYAKEFGVARVKRLARGIQDAVSQWGAGHWDDFVTKINGVCEVLSRHLFETRYAAMGLDKERAARLASKPYRNRLDISEFKQSLGSIQAPMASIHQLRSEAETAHVENADGSEKPGLEKTDAELARDEFKKLFEGYAQIVAKDQGTRD